MEIERIKEKLLLPQWKDVVDNNTVSRHGRIKRQVEYYMSSQNLKNDAFFNTIIKNSPGGWLKIEYLLKCNRIIKLNPERLEIINAISDSHQIE